MAGNKRGRQYCWLFRLLLGGFDWRKWAKLMLFLREAIDVRAVGVIVRLGMRYQANLMEIFFQVWAGNL